MLEPTGGVGGRNGFEGFAQGLQQSVEGSRLRKTKEGLHFAPGLFDGIEFGRVWRQEL